MRCPHRERCPPLVEVSKYHGFCITVLSGGHDEIVEIWKEISFEEKKLKEKLSKIHPSSEGNGVFVEVFVRFVSVCSVAYTAVVS